MRNLIFYTCHRQLLEIELSSIFFNRSEYFKNNFDIIIHCNNSEYELKQIKNYVKFETTSNIILTTKNSGYNYGALEALSDNFGLFYSYNKIIHCHPDCYITDDSKIKPLIEQKYDIAVSEFFHNGRTAFNTDFFIFEPNSNYFLNWNKAKTHVAEHWFCDEVNNNALNILYMDRYPKNIGGCVRDIDQLGVWHSHDPQEVLANLN